MNNINDKMATEVMGWHLASIDCGDAGNRNVYYKDDCAVIESYYIDWHPDTDMNQAIGCWGKAKQSMADDKVMELANRFTDILFAEGNLPLAICEAILEAVDG